MSSQKNELTAEQLAHLDLLIADKQKGDQFFVEISQVCTLTAMAHVDIPAHVVSAITGDHKIPENGDQLAKYIEIGKNISLNQLLEIRNTAIKKI